jgi:tetratricopeptide (TPR) repeat protein
MISRWLLLTLSIVVLSPALLCAQPAPGNSGSPIVARLTFPKGDDDHKMYEDVEIFRRILDRKLHPLYPRTNHPNGGGSMNNWFAIPQGGGMMGMQGGMGMQGTLLLAQPNFAVWQEVVSPTLEGVYLKGQGVVYTATLSSLQTSAKAETTRPLSEWESVRRKLHNEREEAKKPEANKPSALSEVLLKVLAENGHHFSQLGENESLTLVITVHDTSSPPTAGSPKKSPKAVSSTPQGDSSSSSKVRDLELLGDLHMKQEHYGMARDAFRKAVELKPDRKQTAVLARKLAQAYLMLDNLEEARGALDQSIALTKENANAKDKPTPATKPAVALPIKLIVSVSKKLLDEAAKGKMSAEEFRRRASVETLRFEDLRP